MGDVRGPGRLSYFDPLRSPGAAFRQHVAELVGAAVERQARERVEQRDGRAMPKMGVRFPSPALPEPSPAGAERRGQPGSLQGPGAAATPSGERRLSCGREPSAAL